jgi:superfamily II DNA or RNA helicase
MLSELTQDQNRNRLIASDVADESRNTSVVCLVLSDRRAHCEVLVELLRINGVHAALLVGSMKAGDRKRVVDDLNGGKLQVVVATGQLIGEGFDCKALSTLFLACPVKFDGRLLQYLGRILRPAPGKGMPRVYDYVDPVGVLKVAAKARARVYGKAA